MGTSDSSETQVLSLFVQAETFMGRNIADMGDIPWEAWAGSARLMGAKSWLPPSICGSRCLVERSAESENSTHILYDFAPAAALRLAAKAHVASGPWEYVLNPTKLASEAFKAATVSGLPYRKLHIGRRPEDEPLVLGQDCLLSIDSNLAARG